MRWFKHLTMAHADPEISGVLEELGAEAYGVWWLILEDIGAAMEKGTPPVAVHSDVKWAQICYCSARNLRSIVNRLQKKSLIDCTSIDNRLKIAVPNILKYRDEYSKKSRHTPESRADTDTDTDTEKRKPSPTPPSDSDFEGFADWTAEVYSRHPKHKFRFQAEHALQRRFAKDTEARTLFDTNHKLWCATEEWKKNRGTFAPLLADQFGNGWIADDGWRFVPPPATNGRRPVDTSYLDELEGKKA